jgi:hypothetical protein
MLSAVLAACGGTSSAASSAGSAPAAPGHTSAPSHAAIDPCTLVTEAEATTILGADPGPGKNTSFGAVVSCAYSAALTVGIDRSGVTKALFDSMTVAGTQNVSGVGDAAHLTIPVGSTAKMDILKGSDVISIFIQGDPLVTSVTPDALTALGKTVLGRL